ncbi:MAG: DUF2784 domain-containing protein [Gemmataceae bacterium]|nr:DUF2784 domain-containing protein [Gemmataceae bacterium]
MFYGLLADAIALIHLGYVSFVVLGQLFILFGILFRWSWIRNFWFRAIHLGMILIVAAESLGGLMCPLTTWENKLRVLAGQPVQGDSFIARLVDEVMNFNSIPFNHWIFTASYLGFAALVLATFFIAPPRWPKSKHVSRPVPGATDSPTS